MKIYSPSITGSTGILGSLEVSGGITGSLFGTASFVTSASYATFAGSAGSATTAATASYVSGVASPLSGDLRFENILGEIYGTAASPVTGNLTISGTSNKKAGAVAVVYHTGSVEPTVSGGTINKKVGNYSTTTLNVITFTCIDDSNFLEYIAGGTVTTVTSASFATSASFSTISNTVYNNNTSSGSIGFWQGTTAEYNAISGSASNSIIYFVI